MRSGRTFHHFLTDFAIERASNGKPVQGAGDVRGAQVPATLTAETHRPGLLHLASIHKKINQYKKCDFSRHALALAFVCKSNRRFDVSSKERQQTA